MDIVLKSGWISPERKFFSLKTTGNNRETHSNLIRNLVPEWKNENDYEVLEFAFEKGWIRVLYENREQAIQGESLIELKEVIKENLRKLLSTPGVLGLTVEWTFEHGDYFTCELPEGEKELKRFLNSKDQYLHPVELRESNKSNNMKKLSPFLEELRRAMVDEKGYHGFDLYRLKKIDNWPMVEYTDDQHQPGNKKHGQICKETLDLENHEITTLDKDKLVFRGGGDWQPEFTVTIKLVDGKLKVTDCHLTGKDKGKQMKRKDVQKILQIVDVEKLKEELERVSGKTVIIEDRLQPIHRSVVGIVVKDNSILLGKAVTDDDRNGFLVFPGGGVEEGESLLRAVKREVREEAGVLAKFEDKFIEHPSKPGVYFFIGKYINGSIQPNSEFDGMTWYDLNNLPTDEIYPQNKSFLERILKKRIFKSNKLTESEMKDKILVTKDCGDLKKGQLIESYVSTKKGVLSGKNYIPKGNFVYLNEKLSSSDQQEVRALVKKMLLTMFWRMYTRADFITS